MYREIIGEPWDRLSDSVRAVHGPGRSVGTFEVVLIVEQFGGDPCSDLDGYPRLLDFDGDGLAPEDIGAYEMPAPNPTPGEVLDLRWSPTVENTIEWSPQPASDSYNLYRGDLELLGFADWGSCLDQTAETSLSEATVPAPGQGYFYLVSGVQDVNEGTLGVGNCAERSNFSPCGPGAN